MKYTTRVVDTIIKEYWKTVLDFLGTGKRVELGKCLQLFMGVLRAAPVVTGKSYQLRLGVKLLQRGRGYLRRSVESKNDIVDGKLFPKKQ